MEIDKDTQKLTNFIFKVGRTISAGEEKEEVCPVCGGKLHIERALFNGHLHADCEGCGFAIME